MEKYIKKLIIIFISSLISVSHANNLKDWTNEDLCRWIDSDSIPNPISEEIYLRQLSCYISCYSGELTAEIQSCNNNINVKSTKPVFNFPNKDKLNEFSKNSAFEGLDMSGFIPPGIGSMDSRIYYINGLMQTGGSTYISALRSYLESTGQGAAFSFNPPLEIKKHIPVEFTFEITL